MYAIRLPNGRLIIPVRVKSEDGQTVGDGSEEIGPDHPDYAEWLADSRPQRPDDSRDAPPLGDPDWNRRFVTYLREQGYGDEDVVREVRLELDLPDDPAARAWVEEWSR